MCPEWATETYKKVDVIETPVEQLHLNETVRTRLLRTLENNGICTVGQLVRLGRRRFRALYATGFVQELNVARALDELGVKHDFKSTR